MMMAGSMTAMAPILSQVPRDAWGCQWKGFSSNNVQNMNRIGVLRVCRES